MDDIAGKCIIKVLEASSSTKKKSNMIIEIPLFKVQLSIILIVRLVQRGKQEISEQKRLNAQIRRN